MKYRCSLDENDAFEFADIDAVLYENDLIQTEEESCAILGLEDMSTYVLKPESRLIIRDTYDSRPAVVQKLDLIVGTMLVNIKKMAAGKSLEVEMSQCICGGEGTILAFEETGKESRVYLLVGKASVKNKKTGKKTVLKAGQMVTMKGNTSNVATFNVEQEAKKFGCPMSEINNHYTNKKAPKYNMSDICGKPFRALAARSPRAYLLAGKFPKRRQRTRVLTEKANRMLSSRQIAVNPAHLPSAASMPAMVRSVASSSVWTRVKTCAPISPHGGMTTDAWSAAR